MPGGAKGKAISPEKRRRILNEAKVGIILSYKMAQFGETACLERYPALTRREFTSLNTLSGPQLERLLDPDSDTAAMAWDIIEHKALRKQQILYTQQVIGGRHKVHHNTVWNMAQTLDKNDVIEEYEAGIFDVPEYVRGE